MEDDWEKLADEPVVVIPPKPVAVNKWEGEDEDEVKDSWEDEDETEDEKKDEEKQQEAVVVKKKPKTSLKEKIAEKERLKQEENEAKAREREENMTSEEKLAEKLRLQKIQEESDLRAAMDTFGVASDKSGIDGINPTNRVELTELADAVSKKVNQYTKIDDFPGFLEELVRGVCANLSSNDLSKIKRTVDNLYIEKQKIEKEKTKKGGKGKTKARLRVEGDKASIEYGGQYESYDYDDFM